MVYHFGKLGYMAIQVQEAEDTADDNKKKTEGIGLPITDQPKNKPVIEK